MNQVRWQDFDKLHVIRRFRQLIASWWNIQLNFTDEKGFVRGVPKGRFFNPQNQVCQLITGQDKGFRNCIGTVRKTAVDARGVETPKLSRCHAGFSTLSFPIRVEGKFLGCVFGDGFIVSETETEQKLLIRNYLRSQFASDEDSQKFTDQLPVLSEKDIRHLGELIRMVVDEILIAQSILSQAEQEVDQLRSELGNRYSFARMIGKSSPMQSLYQLLERIADSNALVLIQGENGTGKELIAKALHYNSSRKQKKFLAVNCGAFNDNLLESELFGHLKGSFTGAAKDKEGLFEAARDGTLFLDEIGDTSAAMQVKLLRVLQDGTFTPLGGSDIRTSRARIIAATNKDLTAMVRNGEFREDLFYRLNVINVQAPPLRDRKEDISLLTEHFIKKYAQMTHSPQKKISQTCMQMLLNHDWPGNVRELENEIERLCVLSGKEEQLDATHLSSRIKSSDPVASPQPQMEAPFQGKLKDAIEQLERRLILEGLQRTRWNKSRLARELGISRAGLIAKVEKYQLDKRNIQTPSPDEEQKNS